MKKRVILSFFMVFVLICLTGCRYTKEEKDTMEQYKIQAEENAINYTKEKYNISSEVISSEAELENTDPIPNITPDPTGNVYVKMKSNNKEFYVYITGKETSIIGKDNYQYNEIVNDLLNLIQKDTNVAPYNYQVVYGFEDSFNYPGLIDVYYDGTNLYNAIHFDDRYDQGLYVNLNYIGNNNLENIVFSNSSQIINKGHISLINFSTVDDYNNFSKEDSISKVYYSYLLTDEDKQVIDNILLIKEGNKEYFDF